MQRLIKIVIAVALANRSELSIKCVAGGWWFMSLLLACVSSVQKCLASGSPQVVSCAEASRRLNARMEENWFLTHCKRIIIKGTEVSRVSWQTRSLQQAAPSSLYKIASPVSENYPWPEGRGVGQEAKMGMLETVVPSWFSHDWEILGTYSYE